MHDSDNTLVSQLIPVNKKNTVGRFVSLSGVMKQHLTLKRR